MYKKLLVSVDGSTTSRLGLVEAIRLAKQSKATLRVVHVVRSSPVPVLLVREQAEAPWSI